MNKLEELDIPKAHANGQFSAIVNHPQSGMTRRFYNSLEDAQAELSAIPLSLKKREILLNAREALEKVKSRSIVEETDLEMLAAL